MDKPISVGDLVQIVRPSVMCSCPSTMTGTLFLVGNILTCRSRCIHCGAIDETTPHAEAQERHEDGRPFVYPLYRLKRIPPLEELEGLESEEVDKLPTQRMREAAERYKRLVTSK